MALLATLDKFIILSIEKSKAAALLEKIASLSLFKNSDSEFSAISLLYKLNESKYLIFATIW